MKLINNKIVITGAAGFIGSHLAHYLKQNTETEIVGIDSLRSGDWARVPKSTTMITADLSTLSMTELLDILKNADVLFHLAAEKYNSSKSSPEKLLMTNVVATERLFRAAALSHVGRTVFTSSLYAYGSLGPQIMCESDLPRPNTLYGLSKVAGEHIARSIDSEIGFSWNVARLFFIYGPRQHAEGGYKSVIVSNFERLLRGERPVVRGDGLQSLDYVYVDDCVNALVRLSTSKSDRKIVNVATGCPVTITELTSRMNTVAQSNKLPVFTEPDWTTGSRRFGNPSEIFREFGWQSTTSLNEGLSTTFQSMKDLEGYGY